MSVPLNLEERTSTVRILLVEDDDGDALFVEELLELATELEAEVVRARTLAEAGRLARAEFDCILLDLALPDAGGEKVVQTAVAWESNASIVVLTGQVDQAVGLRAVELGAQDFLSKTAVTDFLLAKTIRYAISRRRAEEATLELLEAHLRSAANERIERGLLPAPLLSSHDLAVTRLYRPGGGQRVLGGDFVDLVELRDGCVRVIIGDVAGHGPEEAALGVNLRIAWRTLVLAEHASDAVLPAMERLLQVERADPGIFVTACDLTIGADRTSITVRHAGHPPGLVLVPGLAEMPLDQRGPALGLFEGGQWPPCSFELPRGWSLMLFTDGLIEGYAHPPDPERLGVEGVMKLLASIGADRSDHAAVAQELFAAVTSANGGPVADDMALLLLADRPSH